MARYYQRKFHIGYVLPDGNTWYGFINIDKRTMEELPDAKDVHGTFWAELREDGWHGEFKLEGMDYTCLDKKWIKPYIITSRVEKPVTATLPELAAIYGERVAANMICEMLRPPEYDVISRFGGRLEDGITRYEMDRGYSCMETHCYN